MSLHSIRLVVFNCRYRRDRPSFHNVNRKTLTHTDIRRKGDPFKCAVGCRALYIFNFVRDATGATIELYKKKAGVYVTSLSRVFFVLLRLLTLRRNRENGFHCIISIYIYEYKRIACMHCIYTIPTYNLGLTIEHNVTDKHAHATAHTHTTHYSFFFPHDEVIQFLPSLPSFCKCS